MIVPATIQFKDILNALDLLEIPGVDKANDDWVQLEGVDVDECDIEFDCDVCHGELPEPEREVNSALLADFIQAVKSGDTMTAKALVGRVFEDRSDAAIAGGLL